jgi:hypothetical protein
MKYLILLSLGIFLALSSSAQKPAAISAELLKQHHKISWWYEYQRRSLFSFLYHCQEDFVSCFFLPARYESGDKAQTEDVVVSYTVQLG